jgi:hypothetical protein
MMRERATNRIPASSGVVIADQPFPFTSMRPPSRSPVGSSDATRAVRCRAILRTLCSAEGVVSAEGLTPRARPSSLLIPGWPEGRLCGTAYTSLPRVALAGVGVAPRARRTEKLASGRRRARARRETSSRPPSFYLHGAARSRPRNPHPCPDVAVTPPRLDSLRRERSARA